MKALRASARSVYRAWLQRRLPPSRHQILNQRRIFIFPTRYGFLFLLLAGALFIGGINYENNLILGLSFLMASLFVVAILHTFRNLSGLGLKAGRDEPGFVASHGHLEILLTATDRHAHRSLMLGWPGGSRGTLSVEAGQEESLWLSVPLSRRGRVRPGRLRIETRYPLGMLQAWSLIDLDHHCIAWPKPVACDQCPAGGGQENEGQASPKPGSEDFQGLKSYTPGDSLRQIDWKSFARSGGLQTKYFVDPAEGWLWLEWDRLEGVPAELRLSNLAWWVQLMERQGKSYGLRLPDSELEPGKGEDHHREALDRLALFGGA